MVDRIRFTINRIGERLWVRPLLVCILSIAGAFLAKAADNTEIGEIVPNITQDSIETLLSTISSSMLVIATFAVASMLSAYTSASNVSTPRTFSLIISDDISQNALSTFIGAFIFSIVALIAIKNGFYGTAGRFALFSLTLIVFVFVVLIFVRWTDSIARLGRLGTTVDKVEAATAKALHHRRQTPTLGGIPVKNAGIEGQPIYGQKIGYVQRVDILALQQYAEKSDIHIRVAALPGTFSTPGRPLAYLMSDSDDLSKFDETPILEAFRIGDDRVFDDDPRFGLIVLSEIASRALSPAVNDPGTAIDIIGTFVRLFTLWVKPIETTAKEDSKHDRVEVPELSLHDMFDDAFSSISRDGAGTIEVAVRLQKAFVALSALGNAEMQEAVTKHVQLALARSEKALELPEELALVRALAGSAISE